VLIEIIIGSSFL
jgi:hypothetical protein